MKHNKETNLEGIKEISKLICKSVPIEPLLGGIIASHPFTNAAEQEAPTSASRGRNAWFSGVFLFLILGFAKIYDIITLVKKERLVYATNNYSKTSDFSEFFW